MSERLKQWIESPFPIKGAGGGKLDFDKPYIVQALVYSREKVIEHGLTVGHEIANNVNTLLKLKEGDVLLDLGCGPGLIAYHLLPLLGETGYLYCVDASPEMLSQAEKVLPFGKNVTLIHADIHTVDKLIPQKADAAMLSGNVHLLTNKPMAFSAIRDALKPEGRLVVVCHAYFYKDARNTNYYASLLDALKESRSDLRIIDGLRLPMMSAKELDDVIQTIQSAGFGVQNFESDTWSPDTEDVFGHPPAQTIKKRLEIVQMEVDQNQKGMPERQKQLIAEHILGDVAKGRQAQVYLLCEKKEQIIKFSGINL